jgi:RNA-directed DNA polymerase
MYFEPLWERNAVNTGVPCPKVPMHRKLGLKHQGGRCGYCRLFFTVEDKTEIHHEDGNHKNHRFSNLKLLHLICHDQVHGTKKYTHEHIHGKTYSRQERITEEPCAGKLASTVLETSQEG